MPQIHGIALFLLSENICQREIPLESRSTCTPHFFHQPRVQISNTEDIWYTSRLLGDRMLHDIMKKTYIDAILSKIYTNHCVRATTISWLAHAGIPSREIMRISGHRCEGSLTSYNTDSPDRQKRLNSSILHHNNNIPTPSNSISHSNAHVVSRPNAQFNQVHSTERHLSFQVTFTKQFEIHNSTIQVINHVNSNNHLSQ